MATRSISREAWTTFFDGFSRDHLDQTVTVEAISQDLGDQIIADSQVFRGISADEKDGENRIAIMVGPTVDEGATHSVTAPSEVWLKTAEAGSPESLEIRSADGTATLLTFGQPVLPVPSA